jgi:hypothetical protein
MALANKADAYFAFGASLLQFTTSVANQSYLRLALPQLA